MCTHPFLFDTILCPKKSTVKVDFSLLRDYNKDNLYKNLTEDDVFYIGEINDVLRCYLKENVDENADFSEDTKVDGRIIYKFKMFN